MRWSSPCQDTLLIVQVEDLLAFDEDELHNLVLVHHVHSHVPAVQLRPHQRGAEHYTDPLSGHQVLPGEGQDSEKPQKKKAEFRRAATTMTEVISVLGPCFLHIYIFPYIPQISDSLSLLNAQLYISTKPNSTLPSSLTDCFLDINSWLNCNFLIINHEKTDSNSTWTESNSFFW